MKEDTRCLFFSILRSVFHSNQLTSADKQLLANSMLEEIIKVAAKHDVAHIVSLGLLNNELATEETKPRLQKMVFQAIYRYEKSNYELCKICEALEKAEIPFIPLKGSVLRNFYPEPWMRTSCDIDVLVHEEDLSRAVTCLDKELEYKVQGQFSHDVSLFSKSNVHIELHFDLIESTVSRKSASILKNVWTLSHPKADSSYQYVMPDELFYFYHTVHMAKHFEGGGCGVRPFIDLWILDNIPGIDVEKRNHLLEEGDLLQFANCARSLSEVWFDERPMETVLIRMENYIIRGGVYGNNENRIIIQQQKKGGSVKYALSKIVIPYDELKFHYPILQKHRWLTPIMQVRRWFKLIFCGHAKRSMRELSYNSNISKSQADEMKTFLDEIGL